MPFPPVSQLLPNPSVRTFFSGQLILEPSEDEKTCEAFVNYRATDHHLSIEVRQKRPNKPDVIMMRHFGKLDFIEETPDKQRHGLLIATNVAEKGVKMYDGSGPAPGEEKKLSDALDLKKIHGMDMGNVDGGRPSILLDNGIFHTADMTPSDLTVTLQKKELGSPMRVASPFASLIGANIYLPETPADAPPSMVTLTWRQHGKLTKLDLKRLPEQGAGYEIYINHDPLYEGDSAAATKHDEFEELYKILPGVPSDKQFKMEILERMISARGSTRTPCMPTLKSI